MSAPNNAQPERTGNGLLTSGWVSVAAAGRPATHHPRPYRAARRSANGGGVGKKIWCSNRFPSARAVAAVPIRWSFDHMATPIDEPLRDLLTRLGKIACAHEELEDSECEERMTDAVFDGFIKRQPEFVLPQEFGMYSAAGNADVRTALEHFITLANSKARSLDFPSRLAALQNLDVTVGDEQFCYNDFFRYTPPDQFDTEGNPLADDQIG